MLALVGWLTPEVLQLLIGGVVSIALAVIGRPLRDRIAAQGRQAEFENIADIADRIVKAAMLRKGMSPVTAAFIQGLIARVKDELVSRGLASSQAYVIAEREVLAQLHEDPEVPNDVIREALKP